MTFRENLTRFIQAIQENPHQDIEEVHDLIKETSEDEIRTLSTLFLTLCHTLTDILVKTNRSISGINLISTAIAKYQDHPSQLTTLHSDVCLLCIDSKCFRPADKFLEIDYTELKKTEDRNDDVKRFMLFFYYGGLIYAAVKNFDRASHYFEVVVTMPSHVMNPIMQESFKKLIILNLIMNGNLPDDLLPKYTSQCVLRQRKQAAPAYLKLSAEYPSLNYVKIKSLVTSNINIFTRDENMGLIKQCLKHVHRRNIKRLIKTFLSLPLVDVARYVGLSSPKEAEMYILNMIDDGEISAIINQKDGMVVFQENAENFDSVAVFQKLQQDIAITTNLINTLRRMEDKTESRVLSKINNDI